MECNLQNNSEEASNSNLDKEGGEPQNICMKCSASTKPNFNKL